MSVSQLCKKKNKKKKKIVIRISGNFDEIPVMLWIDDKYPTGHPKDILKFLLDNYDKVTVKHSIESA